MPAWSSRHLTQWRSWAGTVSTSWLSTYSLDSALKAARRTASRCSPDTGAWSGERGASESCAVNGWHALLLVSQMRVRFRRANARRNRNSSRGPRVISSVVGGLAKGGRSDPLRGQSRGCEAALAWGSLLPAAVAARDVQAAQGAAFYLSRACVRPNECQSRQPDGATRHYAPLRGPTQICGARGGRPGGQPSPGALAPPLAPRRDGRPRLTPLPRPARGGNTDALAQGVST
jgi:hypothetical protein